MSYRAPITTCCRRGAGLGFGDSDASPCLAYRRSQRSELLEFAESGRTGAVAATDAAPSPSPHLRTSRGEGAIAVSALLSELQLITLTCHTDKEYNTLNLHLRPALAAKEKNLDAFFTRAYGKRGRLEHDKYITELANLLSQFRLKLGARFCSANASMFDQLMPLSTIKELATYTRSKPIQQALAVNECSAATRPKTTLREKGEQREATTPMPAANPPPGYTWGPGHASFVPLQQAGQAP